MPNTLTFQKAKGRGYNPSQVDALLELARKQYESPDQILLRASDLRGLRLDLVNGGYSVAQVDIALDNIEDHFIKTEIREFRNRFGDQELAKRIQELKDTLIPRLKRESTKRFTRTSLLGKGYDKKQVDLLCEQIVNHFESGVYVGISDIRRVQFRSKRLGYSMPQVDSFLDRVIEALQLEKTD